MRTVLCVLIALLLVSTCFALESNPSNKVGYVKISTIGAVGETYTPFGLPFVFWYVPTGNIPVYGNKSYNPRDIIGDQLPCGDYGTTDFLWMQDWGYTAWRECEAGYVGPMAEEIWDPEVGTGLMIPSAAYWWVNNHGENMDFVLAGEADITGTGIYEAFIYGTDDPFNPAFTAYSWRDPRNVDRAALNLLEAGFQGAEVDYESDQVWEQVGGRSFWYDNLNSVWQYPVEEGGMGTVDPGMAYWIMTTHAGGFAYTYAPTPPAALGSTTAAKAALNKTAKVSSTQVEAQKKALTPSSKTPVNKVQSTKTLQKLPTQQRTSK